jgi:WD40 repeat protein
VFSPCGRWLATTGVDFIIRWWEWPALREAIENGGPLPKAHEIRGSGPAQDEFQHLAIHPSGRIYCTGVAGIVYEWDILAADPAATEQRHQIHSIKYLFCDIAVSADGKWLALGRHGYDTSPRPGSNQMGDMLLLADCSTAGRLNVVHSLPANFRHMGRFEFSADGRWVASIGQDAKARVWDLHAADVAAGAVWAVSPSRARRRTRLMRPSSRSWRNPEKSIFGTGKRARPECAGSVRASRHIRSHFPTTAGWSRVIATGGCGSGRSILLG